MGLYGWFPPMGPYSLRNNVGVWVVCVTPRLSLINGIYVGHLQWDSMRKSPTAWANIYGFGLLGMEDNIFARDGKKVHGDSFAKYTRNGLPILKQ